MSFKNITRKSERAYWEACGLGKILTGKEITNLKKWCRENLADEFYIRPIKETMDNGKLKTVATLVRIKDQADVCMFKIKWAGYE